jgi:hypothetical protein
MGRQFITGFLSEGIDFDIVLDQHLRYNVYPPIPSIMFDACKMAIEMANADQLDAEVELPAGITYKDGSSTSPASEIIEYARLEGFIEYDEEDW